MYEMTLYFHGLAVRVGYQQVLIRCAERIDIRGARVVDACRFHRWAYLRGMLASEAINEPAAPIEKSRARILRIARGLHMRHWAFGRGENKRAGQMRSVA